MKGIFRYALGLAVVASAFGDTILDISTGNGNANWQVLGPGTGFTNISAVDVTGHTNATWAPAPAGTSWVSWGTFEGVSCTSAATGPANSCASTNFSNNDVWQYSLTLSSAQLLGATSGTLNFIFGSDNAVNVFVGNEPGQSTSSNGYSSLYCSSTGGATAIVGNNYAGCTSTISFNASDLVAGALTITAYASNPPIVPACPTCGNPSGFILDGSLDVPVGGSSTPEPATFGLVSLAGLVGGLVLRKKRSQQ